MVPSTEGTIWDTGTMNDPDDLSVVDHSTLFPDLIADFEIAKVEALKNTKTGTNISAAPKKVAKKVLDPKRSQNMTIMLSKFRKTPPSAIARAILELDREAFEQSILQGMIDQIPTPEEQRAVKKHFEEVGEDSTKLDKAENYVYEMTKVPFLQARLNLLLILLSLEDTKYAIENTVNLVFKATEELKGSARYRRLMHVILTVGNLLNKGSKKSGAVGFRLSSLSKLIQTKSNSGISLIDYVVGHLLKHEPDVLELSNDFSCLNEVKQTSFVSISADVAKMAVGISVGSRIVEGSSNDPDMQGTSQKIKDSVEEISSSVKSMEAMCEEAVQRFSSTCAYLGELVSDPGTLFGQLNALLDCVEKSKNEVKAKIKKGNKPANPVSSLQSIFAAAKIE